MAPVAEETPAVSGTRKRRSTQRPDRPKRRPQALPVLVVDETVLLPHMSIPFPIEDEEAALVIDRASRMPNRQILVLTERPIKKPTTIEQDAADFRDLFADLGLMDNTSTEAEPVDETTEWIPDEDLNDDDYELCEVGVVAEVGQRITRPGGHAHVILQGVARGIVVNFIQQEPYLVARVNRHDDPVVASPESEAAMTAVLEQIENYISMLPNVPEEVLTMVKSVEEPGWLADLIAFSPEFSAVQRQDLLEVLDPVDRLRHLSVMIQKRLIVLNLRQQIASEAQAGMDRQQREYFLREQIRAIQKELGEGSAEETLAERAPRQDRRMPGCRTTSSRRRLCKSSGSNSNIHFRRKSGSSAPIWNGSSNCHGRWRPRIDSISTEAAEILNADHYGLEKVKERIIEYIAVRKLAGDKLRAPIICFVGPPGVGKTSLGNSIARAIGRNYVRMSLGGVRDEAEIRGHRRTYVGAMPGRVVKALRDAKSNNPVMVLDEIDKVGSDASVAIRPRRCSKCSTRSRIRSFSDHYLEVPFDLSKVIFITTANLLEPIPPALRDRMEIIEVPGYTEVEKLAIARDFLVPKALESHGLTAEQLTITDDAMRRDDSRITPRNRVFVTWSGRSGPLCRKIARNFAGRRTAGADDDR